MRTEGAAAPDPGTGSPTTAARRRRVPRLIRFSALFVVGCVVALTALGRLVGPSLTFLAQADEPALSELPGGEPLVYRAEDGVELHSWWLAAPPSTAGPVPTVVVFHGNRANRSMSVPLARGLHARGMDVLLAEYRGYGGSEGSPSEDGLALDARAAVDAASRRSGRAPATMTYVGLSLGTGVAVRLATEVPPAALVLVSPYRSIPDVAASQLPLLPYRLLLADHFDTMSRVGGVGAPLLVVAGDADPLVPVDQSRDVYAAAGNPQQLVVLPGVGHDGTTFGGPATIEATAGFVERWTPQAS